MNETLATTTRSVTTRTRYGAFTRIARRALFSQLAALRDGSVALTDHLGTYRFGDESSSPIRIEVVDARFYTAVLRGGTPAAGRAFSEGLWRCSDLTALLRLFVRNMSAADAMERPAAWWSGAASRVGSVLRRNTPRGSRRNIYAHYDLGNDFFGLFLDPTMTYSSAFFEHDDATLEAASVAKLDRLCRKLDLQPHHHLLEIGTGWGSMALHAAQHYGCRVTTTTISREQHDLATSRVRDAGLGDRVAVLEQDYRDLRGEFDRVVSIEMIEAVGHRFLPTYFSTIDRLLKPDGLCAIQAITMPDQRYDQYLRSVDFIRQYIFPGSCVPSLQAITSAAAKASNLRLVHLEDITPHYARTLREWRQRFEARRDDARRLGLDDDFLRLWEFYFCYCEAGFAERYVGTVQLVMSHPRATVPPALSGLDGSPA